MKKLDVRTDKITVGVAAHSDPLKQNKGITLIALIITIIVMLILVGVTINVALNGGLFTKAEDAANSTTVEAEKEALSMAAIAAWDVENGVDWGAMQLPDGFSGSAGTYTSNNSKKTYKVDKATAKVTEGENVTEVEKIVTAEDEEYSYWKTDGNGTIIYYELPEGVAVPETLVIPCKIGDEIITAIGDYALYGIAVERNEDGLLVLDGDGWPIEISEGTTAMAGVKNVVVSKGIYKIGESSFEDNTNLMSVRLPNTITEIGRWAFCDSPSLTKIDFPEGLVSIGQRAFERTNLTGEFTIPASVDNLGEGAFAYCENLTTIIIKGKIEEDMIYTDVYSRSGWETGWNNMLYANIVWDN